MYCEKSSSVKTLIKLGNFTNFASGLKCVNIKNEKLEHSGKFYKIFAIIIFMIITIEFLKSSYMNIQLTLDVFNITVVMTFTFSEMATLFTYLFMVVNTIFAKHKIRMKIYEALVEVDEELEFDDINHSKTFKRNTVLFYLTYVSLKIFHCVSNSIMWPQFHIWVFHFCSIAIDFQIIHFVMEINIVARRFEILRLSMERIVCKNVDLELQDGFIANLWKNEQIHKKLNCSKLLSTLNKLTNIIEDINYFYGSTVIIFNYNYKSFFYLKNL